MSVDAPSAVLTSVIWNWDIYYTFLVQSVIDGTFTATPWLGSLKDEVIDISPLNENITWKPETILLLEEERRRIESGTFNFSDDAIRNGINWYHHNVIEIR